MNLENNKILITGGATGIGFGMAERFLKEKNQVIICGRRQSALDDAKAKYPALITRQCDLMKSDDRIALYDWILKEHPDTNVLVNNAGIQNWMKITDPDFFPRAHEEIVINVEAPLHLTSLFINLKTLDTILNITSGLSFVPLTKTPVYSGTKAFFHSFTLSLRALLKEKNISVIEVIPPALNTDLGGKGLHDFAPPVSEFIESIFAQLKEGKNELTFGFTEAMSKAGADVFQPVFARMNAAG